MLGLTTLGLERLRAEMIELRNFIHSHGSNVSAHHKTTLKALMIAIGTVTAELSEASLLARRGADNDAARMKHLRLLLENEISDFCAGLDSPGKPETADEMQVDLMQRIGQYFDELKPKDITDSTAQQVESLAQPVNPADALAELARRSQIPVDAAAIAKMREVCEAKLVDQQSCNHAWLPVQAGNVVYQQCSRCYMKLYPFKVSEQAAQEKPAPAYCIHKWLPFYCDDQVFERCSKCGLRRPAGLASNSGDSERFREGGI